MKYIYITIFLFVSFFLAGFIQFNDTPIQLRYFDWVTPRLPVSAYIIACFFAGWFLSMLAGFASGLRFRFRASSAERELKKVRSELDQLKKDDTRAVTSEFQSETQVSSGEPSRMDNTEMDTSDETGDGGYGGDQDPDDPTVPARTGGGEEK